MEKKEPTEVGAETQNRRASVGKQEFERLAAFRYQMRRFLRFSEECARRQGITPRQHQLLLAVKGFPGRDWATVSELAERLQLRHHSVVGIIDRSVAAGLVLRQRGEKDRRVIEIRLTPRGESTLLAVTLANRQEWVHMRDAWQSMLDLV